MFNLYICEAQERVIARSLACFLSRSLIFRQDAKRSYKTVLNVKWELGFAYFQCWELGFLWLSSLGMGFLKRHWECEKDFKELRLRFQDILLMGIRFRNKLGLENGIVHII